MRAITLFAIALLCACGPARRTETANSNVHLDVEPDAVSAGDTVVLVLGNRSSNSLGYNLCTSGLERQSDGDWQAVPSDRVCTMELRTLAPGAQARYPLDLPERLDPGTYRFVTTVEVLETGERRSVVSDPFRVRG